MYEVQIHLTNGSANGQAARFSSIEECIRHARSVPGADRYCILQPDSSKVSGWGTHTDWTAIERPGDADAEGPHLTITRRANGKTKRETIPCANPGELFQAFDAIRQQWREARQADGRSYQQQEKGAVTAWWTDEEKVTVEQVYA